MHLSHNTHILYLSQQSMQMGGVILQNVCESIDQKESNSSKTFVKYRHIAINMSHAAHGLMNNQLVEDEDGSL